MSFHPGGQFIIDKIDGHEIDCYFYGGYNLEGMKVKGYNHTIYALSFLEKNYFGSLDDDSLIINSSILFNESNKKSVQL